MTGHLNLRQEADFSHSPAIKCTAHLLFVLLPPKFANPMINETLNIIR